MATPDFEDGGGGGGVELQSYSQGRKQTGPRCCEGINEPNIEMMHGYYCCGYYYTSSMIDNNYYGAASHNYTVYLY